MTSSIVWLSTPTDLVHKSDKATQCDIAKGLGAIDGIDEEADKMPILRHQLATKLKIVMGENSNLKFVMDCEPMVTASELMAHAIIDAKGATDLCAKGRWAVQTFAMPCAVSIEAYFTRKAQCKTPLAGEAARPA